MPLANHPRQAEYQQAGYAAEQPTPDAYAVPFDYNVGPWAANYTYVDPEYAPYRDAGMHQGEPINSGIPLHAPIPVSGCSTLLASNSSDTQALAFSPHSYPAPVEETKPHIGEQTNPLDVYLHAPQVLFPTPSELLTDLNAREREARDGSEAAGKGVPKPTARSPKTPRSKTDVEEPENLNQRKQYFRSVSDNVGFSITDP